MTGQSPDEQRRALNSLKASAFAAVRAGATTEQIQQVIDEGMAEAYRIIAESQQADLLLQQHHQRRRRAA